MTIYTMILISFFLLIAYSIWQHNNISIIAREKALLFCKQAGVQLLDQNILLKRISIKRSPHSLFSFKRCYSFEFSSAGDFRYQGWIALIGNKVHHIELEPFKTYSDLK
jgi:hypothetical protein